MTTPANDNDGEEALGDLEAEQLAERGSLEEIAELVLGVLDWESSADLLDLSEDTRGLFLRRFRTSTLAEPPDLDSPEGDEVARNLLLSETVLESNERFKEAAAFYVLAHDDITASPEPAMRYRQLVLRFKLGHVLWQVEEFDESNIRRWAHFGERTLHGLEDLWRKISRETYDYLSQELHEWIGRRWDSVGEYGRAEHAYSQASIGARTTDDRVSNLVFAAGAKAKGGDPQAAYELLSLAKDDLEDCANEDTRELWRQSFHQLRLELGGDGKSMSSGADREVAGPATFQHLMEDLLEGRPDSIDPKRLQSFFEPMVERAQLELSEASEEEIDYIHRTLVFLATTAGATESDDSSRAWDYLHLAERIESSVESAAQKVQRKLIAARLHHRAGSFAESLELLAGAADSAREHLGDDDRLAFHGHYLESLMVEGAARRDTIHKVVDEVIADLAAALAERPGAPARRRAIDIHRRVLESAVLALLSIGLLLPEDPLSALPLEMLPEHEGEKTRFGQGRSVVYGLRNEPPEEILRPVEIDRGWLGLGGVPASGRVTELAGSEAEVRRIQRFLDDAGHPASCLLGTAAHAGRLERELEDRRPAVLHLAVHGFADSAYPEVCTLFLADHPGRPGRELLPFRRIADLPLEGVDLVVLSACSSLIGRHGRATTMEGLAWAFLRSGVTQVLASRYPVGDRATSRLMPIFYQELLTSSPAEALGRTRQICLTLERFDPREIAAWSLWC